MGDDASSPVYAVYFPADIAKSPRTVFPTLKEAVSFANSPEGKSNGARFNRFGTPKDAMDFLNAGEYRNPNSTSTPSLPLEPIIPHPSVSRVEMNNLKRAIEKGTLQTVCDIIDSNPRYLVNTNGDTAAIVMEGFRFNALHIAARHGKADVVERILKLVTDTAFLASLYGTSVEDAQFRSSNIIASYLNTPDKGNCETPLHLAAKFGHVDVVRVLVNQPLLEKHLPNIDGKTAFELACSRYTGSDKNQRKKELELLLGGFFVAVYRSLDNSDIAKIFLSESLPMSTLNNDADRICSPSQTNLKLSGYAGPFGTKIRAMNFLESWNGTGKHLKLSDADKGYERVGRELSEKFNVKWAETWCFLDRLVDLRSDEGLSCLNSYLSRLKSKEPLPTTDAVRKKLVFDDGDELPWLFTLNGDEDEFEDAVESVDDVERMVLNDSLASLPDRLRALTLNSPRSVEIKDKSRSEVDDLRDFFTPPATPPPVFLMDHPTKVDNDVMTALANVPQNQINRFSHVRQFTEKIQRFSTRLRLEWPALDSPRRHKYRSQSFIS